MYDLLVPVVDGFDVVVAHYPLVEKSFEPG
jgi:hypothetical protein